MTMYFTLDGRLVIEREIEGRKVLVESPGAYMKLCAIQDALKRKSDE